MSRKNNSVKAKKLTKKEIYALYGIEYNDGKILAPEFGWINPLLIDGNTKLGKGVWTFSILPANIVFHIEIDGRHYDIKGSCPCNCPGCYAQTGNYNFRDVKASNGRKTWLVYNALDFVRRAIIAQIKADKIQLVRIHAAGDFCSLDYIHAWRDIVTECPETVFWTYTKFTAAVNAFSDLENINIVKSVIQGLGFNFGKCSYILKAYRALVDAGKSVYICRCGIDKDQHCTNCKGCSRNEYVLFIEHSTGYVAENDPAFPELKAIIEAQPKA